MRRRLWRSTDLEESERGGGACELCGRVVGRLTRHHLTPREHGGEATATFCSACHRQVHALFTNSTLAAELPSLDQLRADPDIQRYVAWARKQPDRRIPVRKGRSRR